MRGEFPTHSWGVRQPFVVSRPVRQAQGKASPGTLGRLTMNGGLPTNEGGVLAPFALSESKGER